MQAARRGDHVAALPALQRALEIEPTHAKARQALLSVLVGSRQWNEARQVAQTGLAVDPTQSGLATILARLQFEQGDSPAALDTLSRHAIHAGDNADYQGLFAYLLQKQQRPAEAVQRFQAALALRPGEGRWWFGLGLSLESAGRTAEAKEAYARAKEVGNLAADMAAVVDQKLR
jgi:MSHA biogenesis protein MshN